MSNYLISIYKNSATKVWLYLETWMMFTGLKVGPLMYLLWISLYLKNTSACYIDFDASKTPSGFPSVRPPQRALSMWLQHNNAVIVKSVTAMPPPLSASVDSIWGFHDNFGTLCLSALNACLLPSLWGVVHLANHLSHVYMSVSEKQK